MKNLVVLGATGSIGQSAAKVARDIPDRMRIVGISAHRNPAKLVEMAAEFPDAALCVTHPDAVAEIPTDLRKSRRFFEGEEGLIQLATLRGGIGTGNACPGAQASHLDNGFKDHD